MTELIELLSWAHAQLQNCNEGVRTYDDDLEADHGDGVFCGRQEAYKKMIKYCAEKIANSN